MNAQAIDKLWHVSGVEDVVGKENAEEQYLQLVKEAEKRLHRKQANNSFELDATNNKIAVCEEKIEGFQKARKKLEAEIKNLVAQEKAELFKLAMIEKFEKNQLKKEAVALTDEIQEIKELDRSLTRAFKHPREDRFFGKNGDGSSTYLGIIHGLVSVSDVKNLNGRERRARLAFAAALGAETMPSWVRNRENPPIDNWTEIAGGKTGGILCHNGVSAEQLGSILVHLYDLSPVDSPIRTLKRRRSLSRGRSVSAASRGPAKKRRISTEEIPAIVYSITKSLMEQGAFEPDGSEEEFEG